MVKNYTAKRIGGLYKKGLSANTIARALKLTLSQVYSSLKKQNIPRRNASAQNRIRFENSSLSFNFKKNLNSREKELLVSAVMLYLGEGAKTGNTVDFANSDPRIMKVFIQFLRTICRVDQKRIKLYLYCFANQNAKELIKFWSKELKVKSLNFTQPYIRKVNPNSKRSISWGVLHIRYSDKRLLAKILSLSDVVTKRLIMGRW